MVFSLHSGEKYTFMSTMQEVWLKIKIIKKLNNYKNPTTVCFPLMGSSGGVEFIYVMKKLLLGCEQITLVIVLYPWTKFGLI